MTYTQTPFAALLIFLFFSCNDKNTSAPCPSQIIEKNKTVINISEILADTGFAIKSTAIAGEPLAFSFKHPYSAKVVSAKWDLDNSNFTSDKQTFNLRFTDAGTVQVTLFVEYAPLAYCETPKNFIDTVHTSLHLLPTDHSSILEGKYIGTLDTASSTPFLISINYYRSPGDDVGRYYLYNYVQGCTGDGINVNVPKGTGYEIIAGYSNFNMQLSYACAAPGTFKGFGYLNTAGDSITIQHFGYSTTSTSETDPKWHVFKGKKL